MLIILGTWTGLEAPKLEQNLPTPWLGLVERILILIFLVWIAALAVLLLRTKNEQQTLSEERHNESASFVT
jgi:hypothetical protein